ncbi:hypothetical protein CC79DRAFT_1392607 [Sarocladium strictum]
MPPIKFQQSHPQTEPEERPVPQLSRRTRKPKPSFGRDKNGPASSPPPSPPQVVTPEPRRSRRVSSATSSSRLSLDPVSEDELGMSTRSSTVGDNEPYQSLSTPSRSPRLNSSTLAPPKLRSCHSAPSPTTSTVSNSDHSSRPRIRQRTVSAPTKPKATVRAIDRELEKLIMESKPKDVENEGYSYILTAKRMESSDSFLFKVGKAVDVKRRVQQIKTSCKFEELLENGNVPHGRLKLYSVAEALMKKELQSFRASFPCPCNAKHTEYFDVEDTEIVTRAFNRWHDFCNQKPWDAQGNLGQWWKYRLQHKPKLEDCHDHHDLLRVWDQFVNPTLPQEYIWDARYMWSRVSPNLWQTVVFVEAMAIALLSSFAFRAWIWLLFICLCMYLDNMQLGPLRTLKRLSDYLDKVGIEDVPRKKRPLVAFGPAVQPRDEDGMELDMEPGDKGQETDSLLSTEPGNRGSCTDLPGGWGDEDDAAGSDLTVHSSSVNDTFDEEHEEDDAEDADDSILTEDSEISFVGSSKECPILIA